MEDEEVRKRRAQVEAYLRDKIPIWRGQSRELYLGRDGFYVVRDVITPSFIDYIGVTPEGVLEDLSGLPLASSDYKVAVSVLLAARQYEALRRVMARYPQYKGT